MKVIIEWTGFLNNICGILALLITVHQMRKANKKRPKRKPTKAQRKRRKRK